MMVGKGKGYSIMYTMLVVYVLCSALGLTLIKMGGNRAASLDFTDGIMNLHIGTIMLAGFVLYVVSFLLAVAILPKFELSYFYPISAGLVYIAVVVCAVVLLKESVSTMKFLGMGLILAGIIVMNLKKW